MKILKIGDFDLIRIKIVEDCDSNVTSMIASIVDD